MVNKNIFNYGIEKSSKNFITVHALIMSKVVKKVVLYLNLKAECSVSHESALFKVEAKLNPPPMN